MACKIVIVSGKLGSGKDTLADFLIDECRYQKISFMRLVFASYFKACLMHVFQLENHWFYDRDKKESKIPGFEVSPREMMIKFSDFVRSCKPTLFVDVIKTKIDELIFEDGLLTGKDEDLELILITDARMQKEFEMLSQFDPISILVKRNTGILSVADNHESETFIDSIPEDKWSFVVENNGSLEDLSRSAEEIINHIVSRYKPPSRSKM